MKKLGIHVVLAGFCMLLATASLAEMRFNLQMRDAQGKEFTVFLASTNEKVEIITEDMAMSAYDAGDRVVSGKYRLSLQAADWPEARIQTVAPFPDNDFEGEFNLKRNMVYVVKGQHGEPDILSIEQFGGTGMNIADVICRPILSH